MVHHRVHHHIKNGQVQRVLLGHAPKPLKYHAMVPPPPPAGEPQIYCVSFLCTAGPRQCIVEGFQGRAATQTGLRMHFLHCHVRDTDVFVNEVNLHHPWCPCCDMMVPWAALNSRHPNISQCTKGVLKSQRIQEEKVIPGM